MKVKDWSQGIKYLEFKVLEQPGLYIRLNKSHFNFETETVTVNSRKIFPFTTVKESLVNNTIR